MDLTEIKHFFYCPHSKTASADFPNAFKHASTGWRGSPCEGCTFPGHVAHYNMLLAITVINPGDVFPPTDYQLHMGNCQDLRKRNVIH